MLKLIDGKKIAEKILLKTAEKVVRLKEKNSPPHLGVILIGNDKASEMYIKKKEEAAKKIGINFHLFRFPTTISKEKIINEIKLIQNNNTLTGLIIQLPVPEHLYVSEVLNAVDSSIDIDCLTDINLGKLIMNTFTIEPPTAGGVMTVLRELKINLVGKNICLVGMGILVGKPLANLLINARASVTTCNSKTKNLQKKCFQADIIVSGVGKRNLIRGNMIKKGAVVIDTGISFLKNKVVGDVNIAEAVKKARCVTPTPGGIGPITVALLLYNTAVCAEKLLSKKNL